MADALLSLESKTSKNSRWMTSDTHPLRIDSVTTPAGGTIGMTFCPGKYDPHGHYGAWSRDLDADLQVIADFGAGTLVTLLRDYELELLHVPSIGDAAKRIDLDWYHLPIQDVGVPEERFEARWETAGPALKRKLSAGECLVLHCRGGLGRTGLVAARLLIEMGLQPKVAIKQVRRARSGAIETRKQEEYLLRGFNSNAE